MGRYNNAKWNKEYKSNPKISIITVSVSDEILDLLAVGKAKGWWSSRSEGVRMGLSIGLTELLNERVAMRRIVLDNLKKEGKLDPGKKYVCIPDMGYIEIIGVA